MKYLILRCTKLKHMSLFLFLIFFQYSGIGYTVETSRMAHTQKTSIEKLNITLLADQWHPFTFVDTNKSSLGILLDMIETI